MRTSLSFVDMALSQPGSVAREVPPDHSYHPLRVGRVVQETAEATSFVLQVPEDLRPAFAYESGQFCTFRVRVDGEPHVRCYSISSAPAVDDELRVTVTRIPGGTVSNWIHDHLAPGSVVEVARPAGFFRLGADDRDVLAFSAGSGITPVLSLMKTALATTERRVRLLYANQDHGSVIFRAELDALVHRYGDRCTVVHHLDVERGLVGPEAVRAVADGAGDAECYVCGPGPFMDVVEATLLADGVQPPRIHIERFTPAAGVPDPEPVPDAGPAMATRITIELGGRTASTDHYPGTTILQTARQLELAPPFSCESGSCATCMAKLVEGTASMRVNNALTAEEVVDGWILTCQALPTSPTVRVSYDCEEE
jgi:3-ketosteroid 9alpha-monooxygenase subunit B